MPIRAIFFDVGETLVDEHRLYRDYAMRMGVTYDYFIAKIEEAMARREPIRNVFTAVKPGFDFKAARAQRDAEGKTFRYRYPGRAEIAHPERRPGNGLLRWGCEGRRGRRLATGQSRDALVGQSADWHAA